MRTHDKQTRPLVGPSNVASAKSPRNGSIEYLRLIAAFGIVWFHAAAPLPDLGYAGLPMFVALLAVFAWNSKPNATFRSTIMGKARRLLLPWLAWCAVYAALKLAVAINDGGPIEIEYNLAYLLVGTSIHLWFLPFAFIGSLAIWGLRLVLGHYPRTAILASTIAVLPVFEMLSVAAVNERWVGVPFIQWFFVMPFIPIGIALANIRKNEPGWTACFVVASVGPIVAMASAGHLPFLSAYLTGLVVTIAAWFVRLPHSAVAKFCGTTALGVYLIHPIFLALLKVPTVSIDSHILQAFIAFGCSIFAVLLIRKTWFKWMV